MVQDAFRALQAAKQVRSQSQGDTTAGVDRRGDGEGVSREAEKNPHGPREQNKRNAATSHPSKPRTVQEGRSSNPGLGTVPKKRPDDVIHNRKEALPKRAASRHRNARASAQTPAISRGDTHGVEGITVRWSRFGSANESNHEKAEPTPQRSDVQSVHGVIDGVTPRWSIAGSAKDGPTTTAAPSLSEPVNGLGRGGVDGVRVTWSRFGGARDGLPTRRALTTAKPNPLCVDDGVDGVPDEWSLPRSAKRGSPARAASPPSQPDIRGVDGVRVTWSRFGGANEGLPRRRALTTAEPNPSCLDDGVGGVHREWSLPGPAKRGSPARAAWPPPQPDTRGVDGVRVTWSRFGGANDMIPSRATPTTAHSDVSSLPDGAKRRQTCNSTREKGILLCFTSSWFDLFSQLRDSCRY